MPDRLLYRLLCLLLVLAAVPASGAGPAQKDMDEDMDDEEETVETAVPEPPKQVMTIEVRENLLSVELENVDFGAVIRAIAEKARFKVEGSGPVFGKKLNTKFSDIEIDRGVARLLTLLKESNYSINYDSKGAISKLEILSTAGSPAASGTRPATGVGAPVRPQIQQPVRQPAPATVIPPRQVPAPVRPAAPAMRPSAPAARPVQPQVFPDDEDDDEDVEDVESVPYIPQRPSLQRPAFPSRRE